MNEKKIVVVLILASVLILGGAILTLSQGSSSASVAQSRNAKVSVDQKTFDWGQIPYGGGNVSKTFNLKNNGTETLKLTNIKTSCTCTQAQVVIDGKTSPYFSMHSTSGWVGEVLPEKEAQLTVIFDPAFHGPSGVGPINRLVSVQTNDANSPNLEFTLTGTVVK